MPQPLLIREAIPEETDALVRIHFNAISQSKGTAAFYSPGVLDDWAKRLTPKDLRDGLAFKNRMVTLVAESEGQPVGFIQADLRAQSIDMLYCLPGHGAGTTLLQKGEELMREKGCEAVNITAALNAVSFYQHQGYVPREEIPSSPYPHTELAAVQMRKDLSPPLACL